MQDLTAGRGQDVLLTTLSQIGDSAICVDKHGLVTFLNSAAQRLTACDETAIGRPLHSVFRTENPATGETLEDPATKLLRTGIVPGAAEEALLCPRTGPRIPVIAIAAPAGQNTRDGGAVLIFRGRATRAHGRAAISETSGKERIQAHLLRSQKLESLSVLAGGITHDFNNLLMGIIANASLLSDELPPDSRLTRLNDNILAATEDAARLTRQMLAYSRRGRFCVQQVSMASQIEAISSLLKASIKRTIQLNLHLPSNLPLIHADAGQFQQVLMNLVINAAESIDLDGAITVSAAFQQVGRDQHLGNLAGDPLPPGDYVSLKVTDTGTGMDQATLAKMFDPFFSTKLAGRGLGLAAVLEIVQGYGGGILVSSNPGRGTSFQVLFPAYYEGASAQAKM